MAKIGNYSKVNAVWEGAEITAPLTFEQARSAVRKLLRAFKRPMPERFRCGSGNRYNWPRGGVWVLNPDRGWDGLAHDVSHYLHRRINPSLRPHHWKHANIEVRVRRIMLDRGWLSGALLPKPKPSPAPHDERAAKIQARREQIERLDERIKFRESQIRGLQTRRTRALRSLRALERAARDRNELPE